MKKIKEWFSIYWTFAKSEIQDRMAYRLSFFSFFFANILQIFIIYYLWKAIFSSSPSSTLQGFTLLEMITYVFMTNITQRLIDSSADRTLGRDVVEGNIAMNLIRPVNYRVRLLFSDVGSIIYNFIISTIPMWIILLIVQYINAGEVILNSSMFTIYPISLFLSFIILFLFNICFGMIAFHTTYIWGLGMAKLAIVGFLSGQVIPLDFFPRWLRRVLLLFPFESMNYTPVMIYLNKFNKEEIIRSISTQVVWVLILLVLSNYLWNKAIKRLTILGG
ncbi:ABC transporter permease [Halonatronum saccharophilum]|uniref:ABC transporter permease n=1 Tax=Halonatronum saccharophilum TaxID=150060 RepID=UPI0004BA8FE8|nr:ABC-2 family transporter protein [Halonatronum saccharophilum]